MSKKKKERKALSFRPSPVPTPEEIQERAEAIKRKWTPEEKEKRIAFAYKSMRWVPPVISSEYEIDPDIYGYDYI